MTDILLDTADYDTMVSNGDFVAGESTQQHQALLILTEKGELREYPTRGVGAQTWICDDVSFGDFRAEVKRQFELDGMKVYSLRGSNTNLVTEAYYE